MKNIKIFSKMDEFLFKLMDQLTINPHYKMLMGKVEQLPDEYQKIVNYLISSIIIIIPVFITLFLLLGNLSLNTELEERKEIYNLINQITQKQNDSSNAANGLLSSYPLENKGDLDRRLSMIIRSNNIDPNKVRTAKVELEREVGSLVESSAVLSFENISTEEFTKIINSLTIADKMKVSELNISKNQKTNSIIGNISLIHYSRRQN